MNNRSLSSISFSSKYNVSLNQLEQIYIEKAYRKKLNGEIPDPWMQYSYHLDTDWNIIPERLRSINGDGPIWADQDHFANTIQQS